jgi:hypothetical protein
LGIVSDSISGQLELAVDYKKNCAELFTDVARYLLKKYKDFRVLSLVEDVDPQNRLEHLPSWVPDWTSNKILDPRYFVRLGFTQANARFSFTLSDEGKHQLVSEGHIIGRVRMLGSHILSSVRLESDEIRSSWSRYLGPGHDLWKDLGLGNKNPAVKAQREKRNAQFELLVEEAMEAAGLQNSLPFRKFLYLHRRSFEIQVQKTWEPSTEGPSSETLPHLLVLILGLPFFFNGRHVLELLKELQPLEEKRLCVVEGLSHAEGIESSQIVLVPQRVQVGDLICVLDGDSCKMVFRPIKSSESSEENGVDDHFTFVSMCYFHSTGRPGMTPTAPSTLSTKKTFFLQ